MAQVKKGKSGNKKHGRSIQHCELYRLRRQKEKNKVIKLNRHIPMHPNDNVAITALHVVKIVLR